MYTEGFRIEAARKAMLRGDRPFIAVARELGVAAVTLRSWVNNAATGSSSMKKNHFGPKSKRRSAPEKFRILLETSNLAEAELGEYLRRHGLHSAEIEQWKQELTEQLTGPSRSERSEENKIKFANIRLEKEINRKDKALAEVSALLILQKKVSALLGTGEGEEE